MTEIKIEIPKELEEEIKNISNASLSLAINRLIKTELERLIKLKKSISKSQIREEDVKELANRVNEAIFNTFLNCE